MDLRPSYPYGPAFDLERVLRAYRWALRTPGAGALDRRLVRQLAGVGAGLAVPTEINVEWTPRQALAFERWLGGVLDRPASSSPEVCALCDLDGAPGPLVQHACGHRVHIACWAAWCQECRRQNRPRTCPECGQLVGTHGDPAYAFAPGGGVALDLSTYVDAPVSATRALMRRAPPQAGPAELSRARMLDAALTRADDLGDAVVEFMLSEAPAMLVRAAQLRAAVLSSPRLVAGMIERLGEATRAELTDVLDQAFDALRTEFDALSRAAGVAALVALLEDARFVPDRDMFERTLLLNNDLLGAAYPVLAAASDLAARLATRALASDLIHMSEPVLLVWLARPTLAALDAAGRIGAAGRFGAEHHDRQFGLDWWNIVGAVARFGVAADADALARMLAPYQLVSRKHLDSLLVRAMQGLDAVYTRVLLEAGARPDWGLVREAGMSRRTELVALAVPYLDPATLDHMTLDEFVRGMDASSRHIIRMHFARWARRPEARDM